VSGFVAREIVKNDIRSGFRAIGLSDNKVVLAHRKIAGRHRVGKYGVDIEGFERFLSLEMNEREARFYVINEIGRMESTSAGFRSLIDRIFRSEIPLIA